MDKYKKRLEDLQGFINNRNKGYLNRSTFAYESVNQEIESLCHTLYNNKVNNIIEIGTYCGISAALFSSVIKGNVYTINVSKEEMGKAKILWEKVGATNIIQLEGDSLTVLPELIKEVNDVGFIYVDGEHWRDYPLKEYEIIKKNLDLGYLAKDALIYFDDGRTDVQKVIEKYGLATILMKNNALRAYETLGNFKLEEELFTQGTEKAGLDEFATYFKKYKAGLHCRANTFGVALSLAYKRNHRILVETGTARKEQPDFRGDGASTVLLGDYCSVWGGEVWTIDNDEECIKNCRTVTERYKKHINYIVSDSVEFLDNFDQKIDFLYLDSMIASDPRAHMHNLLEFQKAEKFLHKDSVVLIDDCYIEDSICVRGKGVLSCEYMISNGWKLLNPSGNQALFVRVD